VSKPASGVLPPEGSDPAADPSEAATVQKRRRNRSPARLAAALAAGRAGTAASAARRARGEPEPEHLDPVERARRKPGSRALAIAAKCWTCMRGDLDSGARGRIRECPSTACGLHPFRPYQREPST